jgi:hypothetical protein
MSDLNEDKVYDLIVVARFLLWYQKENPDAVWGGEKIEEVIDSFSSLTGFDIALLQNIASFQK